MCLMDEDKHSFRATLYRTDEVPLAWDEEKLSLRVTSYRIDEV